MDELKSNGVRKRGLKKQRLILALILLAGAGTALWLAGVFDQEPRYQGRPASYWLDLACKGTNVDEAFKAMGSNAAPFLARALEKKPSSLNEKLSDFRLRRHVPEVLRKYFLERVVRIIEGRQEAARLLSELGPDAEPALPVLLRIFREGDERELVQTYVNNTLVAMGDRIAFMVPELLQNLTNNQPHIRVLCAQMLGSIGPKAKPAVPVLLEATESSDWGGWLALSAGKALMSIDGQTNVALRVLTNALQHTDSTMRQFALMDLRKLGPAARAATPAVQKALRDPDAQVREEASKTLNEIDAQELQRAVIRMNEELADQADRLIDKVRNAPFAEQMRAVEALSVIGPDAMKAVPVLMDVLRQTTVTNFPAPLAVKALEFSALNGLRTAAANALGAIGPQAHAATPLLVERMRDQDSYTAIRCCRALGKIGPDAKEAIPALRIALDDANANIRLAAARALIRIDAGNAAIQSLLKELESHSESMIRLAARVGLWELDRTQPSPLPDLIVVLKERNEASIQLAIEKACAAELLGDLGPTAKEAIPLLTPLLHSAVSETQRTSANAIRNIDHETWTQLGLPGPLALP